MNRKLIQLVENIAPFLILGVAIALIVGIIILFSYVLLWGLLVGAVLWLISSIKNFLLPPKKISNQSEDPKKGRIIEHDDQS